MEQEAESSPSPPYMVGRPMPKEIPVPVDATADKFDLVREVQIGRPARSFDRVILLCWDTNPIGFWVSFELHI
jgi:hypothetical protein